MATVERLRELVGKAREKAPKRGFHQSFELYLTLRGVGLKKQELNINEIISLPHPLSKQGSVCVFASGDAAVRATRAGADRVVEPEELERLAGDKRSTRKIAKRYSFFLAETSLMPRIGRILGPFLGPKGKMPTPLPPNAPVDAMVARLRQATRARTRGQLAVSSKVGDESMDDEKVAENVRAVINAIGGKLPMGVKNIRQAIVKLSMAPPVKAAPEEV